MIIDATHLKLGRIATIAAKAALGGEEVTIINAEKAVITGSKENILAKYQQRRGRHNPEWGPTNPRMADRFVRRTIRGMLPHKTPRGRDALARVMCYIGNPNNLEGSTLEQAALGDSVVKYLYVGDLCKLLGGKA